MSKELKMQFQNKCIGLTDDHRDYIYGTDWKGYAKALEKQAKELKVCLGQLMRSMLVHPDCTEGSEFDDFTTKADNLLNY